MLKLQFYEAEIKLNEKRVYQFLVKLYQDKLIELLLFRQ